MLPILFSILMLAQSPSYAVAGTDWLDYSANLKKGDHCKVEPQKMHPTQAVVGEQEVGGRLAELGKKSKSELKDYLQKKIVPIVIGPEGVPYIIDNHHLCRAILQGNLRDTVYAEVWENYSHMSIDDFWIEMQKDHNGKSWVYLFDENSNPITPKEIPDSLLLLRNYKERSLVWMLIKSGDLLKVDRPFSEMIEARFLHARMTIEDSPKGWIKAKEEGAKWVHSPEARDLPGFVGCSSGLRQNEHM